ncbi:FkbM family methyltransferase [Shimia sp. CNT1-13L.2]|jgi:FkbM family methyltransferase|uniref:FkbM family methyltransferase n=1 Tax=Shimia sp. CNT1-13L.2 TaxID=2959663 RepID=UPI0020CBA001|nr:FkbM family methyltransferase [Shimia sp. CNT1-13L.2]MCP9480875.1 FkbM family methyltransferase [Shimia sp. CNT1-13L.2]
MTKLNRRLLLAARRLIVGDKYSVHGVTVTVPLSVDPEIRYLLARRRPYEDPEARFVRAHVEMGTHVVELGGSIGVVSALIRKAIGPQAKHVIVEANPALAAVCKVNASATANPGCVEVIEAAVDYSGAEQVMFDFGHNAHTGRVSDQGVPVPTTTLGTVAASLPSGPAVLVCDIEGAELSLIFSDTAALERFETVILETHPHAYPDGFEDLDRMLTHLAAQGFAQIDSADDVVIYKRREP